MSPKKKILIYFIFYFSLINFSCELKNLRLTESEQDSKESETNIEPPKFSRISGFYPNNFKLKLLSEENTTIYYTVDSSDPRISPTSKEFKDYILIYDKSSEPNIYSNIGSNQESPISITNFFEYDGPFYPVDKAMIIRAVTKNSKGEFSEVITKTYFVTTEELYKYQDLITISIVTDPENLFDPDIGIYVTGTMYQEAKKKREEKQAEGGDRFMPWGMNNCNYLMKGKEWERDAFITIFDKGKIHLQQKIGIRIKGAFTRNNPGKSFNIYAREKYGQSTIETDLLIDNYDINGNLITSYKSLSLRNIYDEGRLRDKVGRDLFYSREGLTSSNMRISILFLNGEYWGLYLIQEKLDDDFLSRNYLIPRNNVVIAKDNKIEDGPVEEYENFQYFCGNYSLKNVSDEKIYEEINNYIDINSMIELFATGIYISNLDWPAKNDGEWKYFGAPIEGNKFSDGKWRFIIFDLDYSMGADFFWPGSPDSDNFLTVERKKRRAPVNLFVNLLKNNTDFQYKFVNIFCDYGNDVYNIEKINDLIEKYREECTDLIANSELRWSGQNFLFQLEGYAFYKSKYFKALDSLFNFFSQRPNFVYQQMKDFIGLKGNLVDLTIEIKGRGNFQINSITPKIVNGKWTGKYFTGIPITIKAIPEYKYNFKEWSGDIHSIQQNDEIILSESIKIIAVFD